MPSMKRTICRINEDGPAAEGYLDYGDEWKIEEMVAAGEAIVDAPATLEELADFCDQNAEGRNNHSFVGAHRILAAILHQQVGRDTATTIMRAIAEYSGLDYASGCGIGNHPEREAWADFNLPEPWKEWALT